MVRSLRCVLSIAGLAGLAACNNPEMPPDYSPHYTRVPVVTPDNPYRVKRAVAPEACLKRDSTRSNELGEKLPLGCANAYNLQNQVENKRDLFQGRDPGNGLAEPSVRARERYVSGTKDGTKPPGPVVPGGSPSVPSPTMEGPAHKPAPAAQ